MCLIFSSFVRKNFKMDKDKELEKLRSELASSKKEIKSLTGKLKRSQSKVFKQKVELKKKR